MLILSKNMSAASKKSKRMLHAPCFADNTPEFLLQTFLSNENIIVIIIIMKYKTSSNFCVCATQYFFHSSPSQGILAHFLILYSLNINCYYSPLLSTSLVDDKPYYQIKKYIAFYIILTIFHIKNT